MTPQDLTRRDDPKRPTPRDRPQETWPRRLRDHDRTGHAPLACGPLGLLEVIVDLLEREPGADQLLERVLRPRAAHPLEGARDDPAVVGEDAADRLGLACGVVRDDLGCEPRD